MWSEKYRPTRLEDCVLSHLQTNEADLLLACSRSDLLPNLLLVGSAGTGKSTVARILLSREGYSVSQFNASTLEANNLLKRIQTSPVTPFFSGHRCILIDEIDGLTAEAQKSLRSILDNEPNKISWVFTANSCEAIIEPLRSRMIVIDFSAPDVSKEKVHLDAMVQLCEKILQAEKILNYDLIKIRQIVEDNCPDIRQTINRLQVHYLAYGEKQNVGSQAVTGETTPAPEERKKDPVDTNIFYSSRVPLLCGLWGIIAFLCGLYIFLKVQLPFVNLIPTLGILFYAVFAFAVEFEGTQLEGDRLSFPYRPFRIAPFLVVGRKHIRLSTLKRILSLSSVLGVGRAYLRTSKGENVCLCFPSRGSKHDLFNCILAKNINCEVSRLNKSSDVFHY